MKSVLISIRPEWCELIATGEKTIEVRKTVPTLQTPFKAYIYCTKSMTHLYEAHNPTAIQILGPYYTTQHNKTSLAPSSFLNGKVIGEFVCNNVSYIAARIDAHGDRHLENTAFLERRMCLSDEELFKYLYKGEGKDNGGYAWHISNLVMYRGMPRELGEFKKAGFMTEEDWLAALYPNTHCHYEAWAKKFDIERPPQSWCYVEEV